MSAPRGPSPTFLCKSIIPGQLFFDILQGYHSKWLSGHLFWRGIFAETTDSTWVAPLMRLAPLGPDHPCQQRVSF